MKSLGTALASTGVMLGTTAMLAPPFGATGSDLQVIYVITIVLMIVGMVCVTTRKSSGSSE